MLFGQQSGGYQHRHLLAVHRRNERGTQRDFGFTKTHIAANQSVHRFAALQVIDDGGDGSGLIRCFLKAETGGERLVIVRTQLESVADACGALRI